MTAKDRSRLSHLREKPWMAADDTITKIENSVVDDPDLEAKMPDGFRWTTETYIVHDQIQLAFEDEDVIVSDIEAEDDKPIVYLMWNDDY